jgi:hypothetical protein
MRPGEHRVDKAPAKRRGTRRSLVDAASDELTLDDATALNIADHNRTIDAGTEGGTEVTRLSGKESLGRFERYLDAAGTTLGELAEDTVRGRRRLPSFAVVAYAAQIARPDRISQASHRQEIINLKAGLRAERVELGDWEESGASKALKLIRSHLSADAERPAMPILPGDGSLQAVAAAIDDLPLTEVERAALGALHALGFWGGGRASELVRKLQYRHVRVNGKVSRLRITWPGGCKFQDEDLTLVRSTGLLCDPVDAVRRLIAALAAEGIAPGRDDAIFPGFIDGEVVLNPCDNIPEAQRARNGVHAEAMMRDQVTSWYRRWWTEAARAAGLSPTATRRLSLHGLRRGLATAAALAGVPVTEIQGELRHGNWIVTLRYTDEERIDLSAVVDLIDLDDHVADVDPAAVAALANRSGRNGLGAGVCVIVDDAGSRCPRSADEADPAWGQICHLHAQRSRAGIRMTGPVPALPAVGAVCGDAGEVEDAADSARSCAASGCTNTVAWTRNLGDGTLSWLCQDHARAHALDPDGPWDALRVCDGLRCDQTFVQHKNGRPWGALMRFTIGDETLRLCLRCWKAAREADDPADRASWARRVELDGQDCAFCTDETPATLWIPDGQVRAPVCGSHWARWSRAGRPDRLDGEAREPIDRRVVTELPCALCSDGEMARGWITDGADTDRIPACSTHVGRWQRACKPDRLPEDLRGPVERRSVTELPCEFCDDGTLAVKRIPDGGDTMARACSGHVGRHYRAGYPNRLSDKDRAPLVRHRPAA